MDNVAHVRLIDAHTERDGSANDLYLVSYEGLLVFSAFKGRHACVIG